MTDDKFDEYDAYGENNPSVTQRFTPYQGAAPCEPPAPDHNSEGYNVTFVKEKHLPDGNVMLTFDVGYEAIKYAGEAGLKLFLYMGALDITLDQAFEAIWNTYKENLHHGE